MSDQPTSLFTAGPSPGHGTPGSGLGGATTQPLDRPKRRELTWNRGTDLGLVLLRFAVGGVIFAHGVQHVFGLWGGVGLPGLSDALTGFGFRNVNILVWVTALTELVGGAAVVLGAAHAAGRRRPAGTDDQRRAAQGGQRVLHRRTARGGAVELEVVLGLGRRRDRADGRGPHRPGERPHLEPPPRTVGRAVPDHRRRGGACWCSSCCARADPGHGSDPSGDAPDGTRVRARRQCRVGAQRLRHRRGRGRAAATAAPTASIFARRSASTSSATSQVEQARVRRR